jgi:hypothetical protein
VDFDVVTEREERFMAVLLQWLRRIARALEFDQKRTPAGDEELPIWPSPVASQVELDADDAVSSLRLVADPLLNWSFTSVTKDDAGHLQKIVS